MTWPRTCSSKVAVKTTTFSMIRRTRRTAAGLLLANSSAYNKTTCLQIQPRKRTFTVAFKWGRRKLRRTAEVKLVDAYPRRVVSVARACPKVSLTYLLAPCKTVQGIEKSTILIKKGAEEVRGALPAPSRTRRLKTTTSLLWKSVCECTQPLDLRVLSKPMRVVEGRVSTSARTTMKRSVVSRSRNPTLRKRRSLMQVLPNSTNICKKGSESAIKLHKQSQKLTQIIDWLFVI